MLRIRFLAALKTRWLAGSLNKRLKANIDNSCSLPSLIFPEHKSWALVVFTPQNDGHQNFFPTRLIGSWRNLPQKGSNKIPMVNLKWGFKKSDIPERNHAVNLAYLQHFFATSCVMMWFMLRFSREIISTSNNSHIRHIWPSCGPGRRQSPYLCLQEFGFRDNQIKDRYYAEKHLEPTVSKSRNQPYIYIYYIYLYIILVRHLRSQLGHTYRYQLVAPQFCWRDFWKMMSCPFYSSLPSTRCTIFCSFIPIHGCNLGELLIFHIIWQIWAKCWDWKLAKSEWFWKVFTY